MKQTSEGIILAIKVSPKAARNEIVGWENDELKVRLKAVPEKGAANKQLIKYLADLFSIGKTHIKIISGELSPHKRVCITGITLESLETILK